MIANLPQMTNELSSCWKRKVIIVNGTNVSGSKGHIFYTCIPDNIISVIWVVVIEIGNKYHSSLNWCMWVHNVTSTFISFYQIALNRTDVRIWSVSRLTEYWRSYEIVSLVILKNHISLSNCWSLRVIALRMFLVILWGQYHRILATPTPLCLWLQYDTFVTERAENLDHWIETLSYW